MLQAEKERVACLERQRLVCGVLVQMRRCCPQRPISQLLRFACSKCLGLWKISRSARVRMHVAQSKHDEARGGDRAQSRGTGVPNGGGLKARLDNG